VFGNDRSIVRVRNRKLSNLLDKLTKGIGFIDWKTKWSNYDLRISISAPKHLQDLAGWIEDGFYSRGRQQELLEEIKALDPDAKANNGKCFTFRERIGRIRTKSFRKGN
jgi:hypothetical protein